MFLPDSLSENNICIPMKSLEKGDAVQELLNCPAVAEEHPDREKVYRLVMEREALGSTGLGNGVAIPHAKTDDITRLITVVGIAPDGIEFQALDGELSYLFFLILAPPDRAGLHVQALSEIGKIAQSRTLCEMLKNAESAREVMEILRGD